MHLSGIPIAHPHTNAEVSKMFHRVYCEILLLLMHVTPVSMQDMQTAH